MTQLHLEYDMELYYDQPVANCRFTMKCIPVDDWRQRLLYMQVKLEPAVDYSMGRDSFGNGQIYGCVNRSHDRFLLHISGDVDTEDGLKTGAAVPVFCGIYRYPHGRCLPWAEAEKLVRKLPLQDCGTDYDRCLLVMEAVRARFAYVKNETDVHTTAEEAWNKGCGVCQDYAHIYITLLRMAGIPARYVCGLLLGEGESHAWVEAACEGGWTGLDPTHGCPVSNQYIKLGHGRDAADCAINRGLIWGGGRQKQQIWASVQEK